MDSTYIIKGKHTFSSSGTSLGYILLVVGVLFIISPIFDHPVGLAIGGILLLFVGLVLTTTKDEFHLSSDKKRFRKATFFLGIRYGQWEQLPRILEIIVAPVKRKYATQSRTGLTLNYEEKAFQVMLYVENAVRGIVVSEFGRVRASNVADQLSQMLGVRVEEIVDL